MSIWHKEISSAIDAVVDNPAIVRLYRQWLAASQACAPGWPALADFDPRAANSAGLQGSLMLLAQEGGDLRYLHYGTDIQRHTQFDMTGQCVSAFGGELAAFFQRCYDQVLQTGQPLYTVHSSVKAKTVFTWERLILPVRDEMGSSHLCVYNQPLETRAHILEVVLQTARDALLVLRNQPPDAADAAASAEGEWTIVLANDRFAELTGTEARHLAGQSVANVFPQWTTLGLGADCQSAMQDNRHVEREIALHTNGQTRWYALHTGAVPLGCVMRLADITDAKEQALALQADNQRLASWANLDGLTGVANRRALDTCLAEEVQRAHRHQLPLCVALCDIDFFKAYNDRYGHLAGDDCIRTVAKLLTQAALRPTDRVARYGGEEFVLIMPHTTLAGGIEVVSKVRELMANAAIEHDTSQVAPFVTLSFGVAMLAADAHCNANDLLSQADEALYAAKRQGRDCMMISPSS
jgi:diguanylate cyclase (GGDEF)-like protein/PAS domain S-box-containing protein